MESGLTDRVVFITGASGGIGRAVAEAFAAEGALLALQGKRQLKSLEDFVLQKGWSERALVLPADVTRPDEIGAAMDTAAARWGRVDVCVANAGVWPAEDRPLHEVPVERLRATVETNLLGAAWTARAFMAALARTGPRREGGASIVFTGSTAGRFGERDHCDYALSKAGLHGLMRSLKNEIVRLDPYARVNLVEPGWTVTHMARPALRDSAVVKRVVRTMPLRQLARAKDIAHAIVFLSSPLLARHISGEVITVAGGMEGRLLWGEEQLDVKEIHRRLDED
jgi:3-oxoacyl-[acyl-carrier protein] reductase